MADPASGFDITAKLNKASSATSGAITGGVQGGVSSLTKSVAGKQSNLLGYAAVTGLGQVANKAIGKASKNATDKLQQKLGAKMEGVNKALTAVSKVKDAAAKLGNLKDKLPGAAGDLLKKAGGASKLAGLASGLGGKGGGLDEQAQAAVAATSMINAKLADSMFTAKPDDKLIVQDAYGIKDNSTLNTVVDKLNGVAKEAMGAAGGLKGIGKNLIGDVLAGGAINLDGDMLKSRLVDSLGGKSGIINKLSGGLREGLSEFGLPKGVYDRVEATVMGVTQYMSSRNVKDARGTFEMISRITGDETISGFLDVGAEASLLSTIFRETIEMNIPDAIQAMLDKSKSSEASYYALQSNIVVAANIADLKTLSKMIDVLGPQRVNSDCPQAIELVLRSYTFPKGSTAGNYQERFDEMNAIFIRLNPRWGYQLRGEGWVQSTAYFMGISVDAKTLLSNVGPFIQTIQIADQYPSADLAELIVQNYPFALV